MDSRPKWWKYVLSAIVFILAVVLIPLLIVLVQTVIDYFSPRYYKQGQAWIQLMAYVLSPFLVVAAGKKVLGQSSMMHVILSGIAGAYFVFTAAWNYVAGTNSVITTVGLVACGLIYFGLAVATGIEISKGKKGADDGRNT